MSHDQFDGDRRAFLKGIGASTAAGVLGLTGVQSAAAHDLDLSATEVYADVNGVPSGVADPEDADLAVFGTDTSPRHDLVTSAVNDGVAVGFVGDAAKRHLVTGLLGVTPETASEMDGKPAGADDVDYSFGYEYDRDNPTDVAVAVPTSDGVLELHDKTAAFDSDAERFGAAADKYQTASTSSGGRSGYSDEWEYEGRVSSEGSHCPGGDLVRVMWVYSVPTEPGTISYAWSDRMTAGDSDASSCDERPNYYKNSKANRRGIYGEYGGEVIDFDPHTTTSSSEASVSMSSNAGASVSYTYQIPDVTVRTTESIEKEAVRWKHNVDTGSATGETTFVSEPGVIVYYRDDPDVVEYRNDLKYVWDESGTPYQVKAVSDREGSWYVGN